MPSGYTLIESEAAFLKHAFRSDPIFIRGDWLCEWAEEFYRGRQINFTRTRSIVKELLDTFPFLSSESAEKIYALLKQNAQTDITISTEEILQGCFPSPIWETAPSKVQAAEWLLWLDSIKPDDFFEPFFEIICSKWQKFDPHYALAYTCHNSEQAGDLLKNWICFYDFEINKNFGKFPVAVSKEWNEIRCNYWKNEIARTNGNYIQEFLKYDSNYQDKQLVALETIKYFKLYPAELNKEIFNKLVLYATVEEKTLLYQILPLETPTSVPNEPEEVIHWFKQEYLPYRYRAVQLNDRDCIEKSVKLGREFADWYLNFYPVAIAKTKFLTHYKTSELKTTSTNHINLLVILDGLHAVDAQTLLNEILSNNINSHLDLVENSFTFSPLPTVTEYTKNHIVYGSFTSFYDKLEKLGIDIPDKETPVENLANAKPGEIVIWRIQEPDATYHKEGQSADLATKIKGQMMIIENRIAGAINDIPAGTLLRVVITTDHGRLLGMSKRTIEIPEGMSAHGRAAWGVKDIIFDSKGFLVDQDIAYLSKDTFHLGDQTAAIIISDKAFVHDTYSEEFSPHGGLFPEEVIVPWMMFEMNIEKPSFSIRVSGSGQANKEAKALLSITNPSPYNATLISTEIDLGTHKEIIDLEYLLLPKKVNNIEFTVNNWPSVDQTQSGTLTVEISLPNGEIIPSTISLKELISTSMYSRDNILEDLL